MGWESLLHDTEFRLRGGVDGEFPEKEEQYYRSAYSCRGIGVRGFVGYGRSAYASRY